MVKKRNSLFDAGIVLAGMLMGGSAGVLLSFCAFTLAAGQADFTTIFVLGFTTIFINAFSKTTYGCEFGYLKSVLLPAIVWIGIHMIATGRLLNQRMFYDSLASFVIVSILYLSIAVIRKNNIHSPEESDPGAPTDPS